MRCASVRPSPAAVGALAAETHCPSPCCLGTPAQYCQCSGCKVWTLASWAGSWEGGGGGGIVGVGRARPCVTARSPTIISTYRWDWARGGLPVPLDRRWLAAQATSTRCSRVDRSHWQWNCRAWSHLGAPAGADLGTRSCCWLPVLKQQHRARTAVCVAARWLAAHARSSHWWPLPRWAELAMLAGAHVGSPPVPKHQPRARTSAGLAARRSREERPQSRNKPCVPL
jgi:hypothetical protein